MRSRRFPALSMLLMFCVAASGAPEEQTSRDDAIKELSKRIPPGTVTNSQTFDTNGFHVESDRYKQLGAEFKPNGDEFAAISVRAQGAFTVAVTRGMAPAVSHGIDVFHGDSGAPLLTLEDDDGDGRPDGLIYSSVDKAGNVTLQVTDYDMDGQADLRINFVWHYTEIWHAGKWHRVEKRGGQRGIILNGKFVELRRENNRDVVP